MTAMVDQSYGVIPVHKVGLVWEYFLINQKDRLNTGQTFWTFPKGHAENGEAPGLAAKRELFEETGLSLEKLETARVYREEYKYTDNNQIVSKRVSYFVGVVVDKSFNLQETEVHSGKWCTYEEALVLLQAKTKKDILNEVNKELEQQ